MESPDCLNPNTGIRERTRSTIEGLPLVLQAGDFSFLLFGSRSASIGLTLRGEVSRHDEDRTRASGC